MDVAVVGGIGRICCWDRENLLRVIQGRIKGLSRGGVPSGGPQVNNIEANPLRRKICRTNAETSALMQIEQLLDEETQGRTQIESTPGPTCPSQKVYVQRPNGTRQILKVTRGGSRFWSSEPEPPGEGGTNFAKLTRDRKILGLRR